MNWTAVKRCFSERGEQLLVLGTLLTAMPLAAASTARIYVTNRGGTTISVIDPSTNKVVDTITDLESPEVVRFSPDGSRLYIVLRSENNVYVMDRTTKKNIKKIPLSGWGNDALVTSDGKLFVVAIRNTELTAKDAGSLDIIDTKTLVRIKSIKTKRGLHDLALTGNNDYVAAGSADQSVIVFDLKTKEMAWQVQYDQGIQPLVIESNPDGSGRRIFVQLNASNGFSVVDFAKHKEVQRMVYPDEPKGFNVRSCEGMSHGIDIAPDKKTLWANSRTANAVFAYSLPELKLLGHVSLPEVEVPGNAPRSAGPAWVTFTPDSKTVYVSTCGTKSVSAIDMARMKEIARIPVGEMPDRISTLVLP
jgi:YVTN family beta-propeller protein